MARETTKWPSTRWPITKIMSSDGCNGNRVPLEMGPWYDFREFGCHLGNVGSRVMQNYAPSTSPRRCPRPLRAGRPVSRRYGNLQTASPVVIAPDSPLPIHRAAPRCRTRLAADRDVLFQIPCRRLGHRRPPRQLRPHGCGDWVLARLDAGGDGRSALPCLLDTSARALHRRPDDPCADRSTRSPLRRIHAARLSRPLRRQGPEPAPLAPRRRRVCRRGRVAEPSGTARPSSRYALLRAPARHRGVPFRRERIAACRTERAAARLRHRDVHIMFALTIDVD